MVETIACHHAKTASSPKVMDDICYNGYNVWVEISCIKAVYQEFSKNRL